MVNKTIFQGRLVRDPELRHTQSGVEVASFTVVWSEKCNENETKCFLDCTAWRETGIFINQYFGKGQEILVEGRLHTENWTDKDGNNRSSIKMTVYKAHFCGPKRVDGLLNANYGNSTTVQGAAGITAGNFDETNGELPF